MIPFARWLEHQARTIPNRVALVHAGLTWSYAALAARCDAFARGLVRRGLCGRGTRVAWMGHNTPDLLALLFACARSECMLVPLNWRLADAEIAAVLADARPALAVLDDTCAERCGALVSVACARVTDVLEDACEGAPFAVPDAPHAVLLMYTSGTTGAPKGVVLGTDTLEVNALNAIDMHALESSDRVLTVLPMFHVGGLNIQTLPALCVGATVILEPRFDATRALDLIARERPSLTVQVPSSLQALLAHPAWPHTDVSCLRAIATGSTDVPRGLIDAVHARGVPVIQIYGATETGPVAIYQQVEQARSHAGAIGRAGLHTEVSLRDPHGREVEIDQPGEIHLRGGHIAYGYWDALAGRAQAFVTGWFASGDVASCDAEGFYWFKGRIKHVIISGGENIYPAELERILAESPLLVEGAVAGRPDPRWGEVPVVVAVAAVPTVRKRDVLALFDARVARYKQPKDVVFVEHLPRTALGKVEFARLREIVRA